MAGLDAEAQQAWRRFAQKLEAEGGYSTQQILNAHRYWLERYNRGVRDETQLEQAGRVGTESVAPAPAPTEVDLAADEAMAALASLDAPPAEQSMDFTLDETGADTLTGGMGAEALIEDIEGGPEPVTTREFGEQLLADLPPDPVEQQVDLTEMGWSPDAPTNEELAAIQTVTKQPDGKETVTDTVDLSETGWKDWASLGAGLAGSALGVLAPELERDRGYEASLRKRMGGDTLARRESALAAGQLGRGIRSASLGRRDISPALAARNAQMAAAQASTDMMGRAAIASAQERRNAETELANIRKQRRATQINAGLGALSQVGAWLGGQAASERQDAKTRQAQKFQAEQNRLMREAIAKGRGQ